MPVLIWLRMLPVVLLATLLVAGTPAHAQWKPTRDVEFVIPYGLGGGADLLARVLIKIITEEKLTPVNLVAVNRPGGGSAVGVGQVVATKNGDPHTLVLINPQTQITPLQVAEAKGWRDLTPVFNFMLDDYLLLVRKQSPYKDAADLVAQAKTKPPRSVSVGSAGTADDMSIAVFQAASGVQLNTVRFNSGGEALTALLGGHVDLASGNPLEFMSHLQTGNVRGLGVFRPTRFDALNTSATMKEQGIDVKPFQMWRGVAMPKGVPAEAVAYWAGVMRKAGESKTFDEYIKNNVAQLHLVGGADLTTFLETQEQLYKEMLASLKK